MLEHNPLTGRPVNTVNDAERELVIGRHARGYVGLYRYIAEIDTIFVLALSVLRAVGYKP